VVAPLQPAARLAQRPVPARVPGRLAGKVLIVGVLRLMIQRIVMIQHRRDHRRGQPQVLEINHAVRRQAERRLRILNVSQHHVIAHARLRQLYDLSRAGRKCHLRRGRCDGRRTRRLCITPDRRNRQKRRQSQPTRIFCFHNVKLQKRSYCYLRPALVAAYSQCKLIPRNHFRTMDVIR